MQEELRDANRARAAYLDDGGDPIQATRMWPQLYDSVGVGKWSAEPLEPARPDIYLPSLADMLVRLQRLENELNAQREILQGIIAAGHGMKQRPSLPQQQRGEVKPTDGRAGIW